MTKRHIQVDPRDLAPFFDGDVNLMGVAPFSQPGYSNYVLGTALGLWPEQKEFSRQEVAVLGDQIRSRPVTDLKGILQAASTSNRKRLIRPAERLLRAQTGKFFQFNSHHATSPFLFVYCDTLNAITADDCLLFGVRGNDTSLGTAYLQPAGNGYRTVGADGIPLAPQANALREMEEEFGLRASTARHIGRDRTKNRFQVYACPADGGEKWVPAVLNCNLDISVHKFRETASELLPNIQLNHENFGVVVVPISDLKHLAEGKPVNASFYPSRVPATQHLLELSRVVAGSDPISLATFRRFAEQKDAPKIDRGSHRLELDMVQTVRLNASDFANPYTNYLAEALAVVKASGYSLCDTSRRYVEQHSGIESVDKAHAAASIAARPRMAKAVLTK